MKTVSDWGRFALYQHRDSAEFPTEVGDLKRFQVVAARRLALAAIHYGGALCADATGLGKTRTCALAAILVRRKLGSSNPIIVCCPTRVATTWLNTLEGLGVHPKDVVILTHGALSRGNIGPSGAVVIVDEAHRFKSPIAQRTQSLQKTMRNAPTILVSATPVINSLWDLFHLLRLCIDDASSVRLCGWGLEPAFQMAERQAFDLTTLLHRLVVRRVDSPEGMKRPRVKFEVLRYTPNLHEDWVWKNLEPTLEQLSFAIFEGDWPRGLMTEHLRRVWEGGVENLRRLVDYICAYHERWIEVRNTGGVLDRHNFHSLFGEQHAQNVFPFMFASHEPVKTADDAVREDLVIWRELQRHLHLADESTTGLEDAICQLLAQKPDEPLLVFTSFQRAAEGLFQRIAQHLGPGAQVALVTGSKAFATGLGRATSHEILRRFAPVAHQEVLPAHQRIQVLVCTDCLSEGVNLQDCGRVILADLPYTPQAIEQRVGRIVRPGSTHHTVTVFLPRPVSWNDSLGLRTRLAQKFQAAHLAGTPFQTFDGTLANTPDTPLNGPLSSLAQLDELALQHGTSMSLPYEHWCAYGDEEQVWAILRYSSTSSSHIQIVVWEDDCPTPRAMNWVNLLEALLDNTLEMTQSHASRQVLDYTSNLQWRLNSALLAPTEIHPRQVQLWRWARANAPPCFDGWEELRKRLLQPLTRREIECLPEPGEWEALIQVVQSFRIRDTSEIEVHVVSTLQITRTPQPGGQLNDRPPITCA